MELDSLTPGETLIQVGSLEIFEFNLDAIRKILFEAYERLLTTGCLRCV